MAKLSRAEAADHHPDILINYRRVTLTPPVPMICETTSLVRLM